MVGRCTASVIASASRKLFFSPFEYGRTYFAGNKPCLVPKRLKLAAEVMRANAGFHADQARWQVGESRLDLATRPQRFFGISRICIALGCFFDDKLCRQARMVPDCFESGTERVVSDGRVQCNVLTHLG